MRAEFVKDVETSNGTSRKLWKVGDGFVVTSGLTSIFSGPETLVFKSCPDGYVEDFIELEGSFVGDIDHQRAINGYVLSLKEELK